MQPIEGEPEWAGVRLRSVGLDVGSATSHLVFSEITMAKRGQRFVPVGRAVLHRSPILLTPYLSGSTIDVDALVAFIDGQFAAAGLQPSDVACGAVLLTGAALDRANARIAAEVFAAKSGDFVAVSAGDALEAVLAAHGSGAVARSVPGAPVVNVDIGGGTTKLALCENGAVTATAALDAGARLIVVDENDVVVRLEPAGRRVAERLGIAVSVGTRLAPGARKAIAIHLADEMFAASHGSASWLLRTAPLAGSAPVVVLSGGVAEYVSSAPPTAELGDLGRYLAEALCRGADVHVAPQAIRATVLGAALFTVQLSGDTLHLSDPDVLPLRDVPVAALDPIPESVDASALADATRRAAGPVAGSAGSGALAVAVRWTGSATRPRLDATARGIVDGLSDLPDLSTLVLACDDDIGRLLGRRVAALLPDRRVVSVDGIDLRDLDFIDLAPPAGRSNALPVTVKSLVFPAPLPRR